MTSTEENSIETRDGGFDPEEPVPVQTGRNIVTVIGINDYQHWRKLGNAVSDAQGIRNLFVENFGFEEPVPHLYDAAATKDAIVSLVEDQLRAILEPDDALILFFAGHGHTRVDQFDDEEIETGYLVPVDAERDQWSDYITMSDWLGAVSKLPARHIMVILDACHSGFGIGEEMEVYRDAFRYEQDLARRRSRRVFTSAKRDQRALDGGPIAGHSLFTGTLIDGLNWGKADIDGNGLVTGSELGLYVQQQVGQNSRSEQTPDFGSFRYDKRGEMVIKLGDNSFDALKARAFAALQQGDMERLGELLQQIAELRPDSPETLYLQYRLAFYESDVALAGNLAERLFAMDVSHGVIPLSNNDLWDVRIQIPYWRNILSMVSGNSPLKITMLAVENSEISVPLTIETFGRNDGYRGELGSKYQFSIQNSAEYPVFVYMIQIDAVGRIDFVTPWREITTPLGAQEARLTYPFTNGGEPGLVEIRFYSSPTQILELLSPPSVAPPALSFGLGVLNEESGEEENSITEDELSQLRMQAINFFSAIPVRR